jgi:hypothetical protein
MALAKTAYNEYWDTSLAAAGIATLDTFEGGANIPEIKICARGKTTFAILLDNTKDGTNWANYAEYVANALTNNDGTWTHGVEVDVQIPIRCRVRIKNTHASTALDYVVFAKVRERGDAM